MNHTYIICETRKSLQPYFDILNNVFFEDFKLKNTDYAISGGTVVNKLCKIIHNETFEQKDVDVFIFNRKLFGKISESGIDVLRNLKDIGISQ